MKDDNVFLNLAKLACLLLAVNAWKSWRAPQPAPVLQMPGSRLPTNWKYQPLFPPPPPAPGFREFKPLFPERQGSHDLLKKWSFQTEPWPVTTSPSK